jgi:hypothetical protein
MAETLVSSVKKLARDKRALAEKGRQVAAIERRPRSSGPPDTASRPASRHTPINTD